MTLVNSTYVHGITTKEVDKITRGCSQPLGHFGDSE